MTKAQYSSAVIFAALCTAVPFARGADTSSRQDLFYYGDDRVLDLFSGRTAKHKIILEKILDPQAGMITETACFQEKGKPAILSPTYMRVSGSSVTISDTLSADQPGKLTGVGSLYGSAWDWNFLKFSMDYSGVRIEDVNFVVKDKLIARKQVFLADGTPIQLWEVEMTAIKAEDYKRRYKSMGCR